MIFIAQTGIIDLLIIFIALSRPTAIVTGRIKGAAPPAFNRTLGRVALKQASRK